MKLLPCTVAIGHPSAKYFLMKSRRFDATEPLVNSDLTRVLSAEGRRAFAVFHDPVTFRGLSTRHEVHRTITNQVSSTNFFEGLAQGRPIVRIVVTQKRFV